MSQFKRTHCCTDDFLFYFIFHRTYSRAECHSHWLIYHVFLFPKWIGTQNAAQSFAHSANVLLWLPSVAGVDYCQQSRTIERVCTLCCRCVPERECVAQRNTHERRQFTFSIGSHWARPNLKRLFIRIYYFHSLIRQYVSCTSVTIWANEPPSNIPEWKKMENKMGKQFSDRQTHFLHFDETTFAY